MTGRPAPLPHLDVRGQAVERAYDVVGELVEQTYLLGLLAADIEDRQFSELVHALRRASWFAGERLTLLR